MNPLTQMRQIKKLNEKELQLGIAGEKKSWHDVYKDSAWIFVGGLNFDLTEGNVIAVFSQYGEVVNMNMVRDPKTGKSRGFAFICYEDQRSTILAVDNLNGIKVAGRLVRVDHVANYKPPKEKDETDELTRLIYERGCGPEIDINQLEKEAAKREANRVYEKKDGGEKRPFDKPWAKRDSGRDEFIPRGQIKAEFDDDGDFRRGPAPSITSARVKVEVDDEGDFRRSAAPPLAKVKVEYDDDGDIRRGPSKSGYDDDGDIVSAKRRSIEPSSSSSHRHQKESSSSSSKHRSDDRDRDRHRDSSRRTDRR